jgi:tubulin gamma
MFRWQVLNNIRSSPFKDLFNPENFYLSKSGGGAGNNWAKGHELGEEGKEELMELINREADGSDSLEVRRNGRHRILANGVCRAS